MPVAVERSTEGAEYTLSHTIKKMRVLFFAVFLIAAVKGSAAITSGSPPSLYISKGACPFECCVYRKWTANRDLQLMDHPGGKPIAQIRKHDIVSARTGEVTTHPLRFRITQKGPDKEDVPIPIGSIVYLLHPVGEGYWLVWFQGKTIQMDPLYVGPGPRYQWWAKVETHSGQAGWVQMNNNPLRFDKLRSSSGILSRSAVASRPERFPALYRMVRKAQVDGHKLLGGWFGPA
jgi:hypothetical protein